MEYGTLGITYGAWGVLLEILLGVCSLLPKPLTLFMTKICNFPLPHL